MADHTPITIVLEQLVYDDPELLAMARIATVLNQPGLGQEQRARVARWVSSRWGGEPDAG